MARNPRGKGKGKGGKGRAPRQRQRASDQVPTGDGGTEERAPPPANEEARQALMSTKFGELASLENDIANTRKVHLKPLTDKKTKEWRRLKADLNIDQIDLDLAYRAYKRENDALSMENATDRERILRNMRDTFRYLKHGQMVNFLDALDADGKEEADPNDFDGKGDPRASFMRQGEDTEGAEIH